MTHEIKITQEHGVESREEVVPPSLIVVASFIPHTTPWDCAGRKWCREQIAILAAAGIAAWAFVKHDRRLLAPVSVCGFGGTGPAGRVRFGDDMMPGLYRVTVRCEDRPGADAALTKHKTLVHQWLHEDGPMPDIFKEI